MDCANVAPTPVVLYWRRVRTVRYPQLIRPQERSRLTSGADGRPKPEDRVRHPRDQNVALQWASP
jgi:hypothetical protein